MRQLFNWRFVAAVAALAAIALLVQAVLTDDSSLESVIEPEQIERRIDLIDPIASATPSADFAVGLGGRTTGTVELVLDEQRSVRIAPGTYGQIDCDDLTAANQCALLADMLGDAVVWFAIVPQAPRSTVELPPVLDLQDGQAVFDNGWRIPYAPVIERDCPGKEIPTFGDFLRLYSDDSVTILDLETREVVRVRCADESDGS